MNFLIDMNLSSRWADFLTGAGHTAVDWSDEGHPDACDRDVLAWAAERDYVVVTADLDDAAIGAACGARRPGVIVLACGDLAPETQGFAVLDAIRRDGAALAAGAVVAVEPEDSRLRGAPAGG